MNQLLCPSSTTQSYSINWFSLVAIGWLILLSPSLSFAQNQPVNFASYGGDGVEFTANSTLIISPGTKPTVQIITENPKMVSLNGQNYGITYSGGATNQGTLFSYDPGTSIYAKLKDFIAVDGTFPVGSLTVFNGKLYGMTSAGGLLDEGVLFSYDPIRKDYHVVKDFAMKEGQYPFGSLMVTDNKLYGMALPGSATNKAIHIELETASPMRTYTKK